MLSGRRRRDASTASPCEDEKTPAARHSKKPSLTFFFGATASLPATAEKPASAAGRFRARGAERGGGSYLARSLRFVAPPVARTNAMRGARGAAALAVGGSRGRDFRARTRCSGKAADDERRPKLHDGYGARTSKL